jgi:DNA-binding transcriptional regulator YdaS (Cro superfamily)
MRDAALTKIIEAAGGVAALAREIGIKPQAISQWRRIPAERVADVASAFAGQPSEAA